MIFRKKENSLHCHPGAASGIQSVDMDCGSRSAMTQKIRHYGTLLLTFLLPLQTRWIFRQGMHPLYDTPLEWLTLSLFGTEILIALLVCVSFFMTSPTPPSQEGNIKSPPLRRGGWRGLLDENHKKIPQSLTIPLVCLVLFSFLSIIWSLDRDVALQKGTMLTLAIVCTILFIGHERAATLKKVFVVSISLQAVIGFFQVLFGQSLANKWLGMAFHSAFSGQASVVESNVGRILRAYGTLPHPNILGGFLAVASLLVIVKIIADFKHTKPTSEDTDDNRAGIGANLFLTLTLSLLLLGLLLTFSRSAILAFCIATFFLLFCEHRRLHQRLRPVWWLLVLAFIPTVCTAVMLLPELQGRVTGAGRLETHSVEERKNSWVDGLVVFLGSPVVGVGAGQLNPDAYASSAISTEPAHILPLQIAAELGLVGLLLFLWTACALLKHIRSDAFSVSIFLTLAVISLFDHYLWTTWSGNLLLSFGIFLMLSQGRHSLGGGNLEH